MEALNSLLIPTILIIGIMYFLVIRPQQVRQRNHKNMVAALTGLWRMPSFKPLALMNRNRGVHGVNLGHLWDRGDELRAMLSEMLDLFAGGAFKPIVDRSFGFDEAAAALDTETHLVELDVRDRAAVEAARLPWVTGTPAGTPVEPDVKITYASSSTSGSCRTGGVASVSLASPGRSTSTSGMPVSANMSRVIVSTTRASSPPSSSATAMCSAIVDGMPFWAFSSATLPSRPSAG